jgi:hypothetical protein
MDDLIVTCNSSESIAQLKKNLQHQFPIKNMRYLKYFFGIEMTTSNKGLFLNQQKYIVDLLQDSSLLHIKLAATPLDSKLKLDSDGEAIDSLNYYQKLFGKLIYLTITS